MAKAIPRPARPVLWCEELRQLPASLLGGLPSPSKFVLQAHGIEGDIIVVTRSIVEPRPPSREPLFDGPELHALVLGVEAERLDAADFRRLCQRKCEDPDFRLTPEEALSGAQPDPAVALSFGAVLAALDTRLLDVAVVNDSDSDTDLPLDAAA